MKTDIEELSDNQVMLTVEVPPGDLAGELDEAYRRVASKFRLPGFRKGRAPRPVIDAQLGRPVVYEELLNDALPKLYRQAVEQSGIEPVFRPDIEVEQLLGDEESLIFKAKVLVRPKVVLGDYSGVEVSGPDTEVADEEVESRIERLRERFAQLKELDTPAEGGDYVMLDYDAFVGGEKIEDASVVDYFVPLEEGHLQPGFYEQLIGLSKGDTPEVTVGIEPDHPNPKVAGQEVTFKVQIKDVKRKDLPEVDDDFAKQVSEFDTLAEMRSDIEEKILGEKKSAADSDIRRAVLRKAIEEAKMEIPPEMVQTHAEALFSQFNETLAGRDIALEQYLEATSSSRVTMMAGFEQEARTSIENELVLNAVADAEKIEVSDEEIETEIQEGAESAKRSADDIRAELEHNDQMEGFRDELKLKKALDWLVEHANVVPVAEEEAADEKKEDTQE